MVARVDVEMKGSERLTRLFEKASDAHRTVMAKAMVLEANRILNESKRIVPYKLGTLQDSGRVEAPKIDANGIEVEITYGGKAKAYAAVQHWDVTLNHPNGRQALYLQTPVEAAKDTFVRSVMETMARYLKRG